MPFGCWLRWLPSPEAARLLCRLYKSPDKEISDLGGYLTVCPPYREEAKEVFFGLLRQRKYVREVAEACKEFEWQRWWYDVDLGYR